MTRRKYLRSAPYLLAPGQRQIKEWLAVNRGFYANFRDWLHDSSYSESALYLYGLAARLVFSQIDQPYWTIDLDADLNRVRAFVLEQYTSDGTCQTYFKGIAKLEDYLRLRCHRPRAEKAIHWETFIGVLSIELADDVRSYYTHCRRNWTYSAERAYEISIDWLSHLTRPLRWLATHAHCQRIDQIRPQIWYEYVDARLATGIQPVTLNDELRGLQYMLRFFAEQDRSICVRFLRVKVLAENKPLPRDVPLDQLLKLLKCVETSAQSTHGLVRRLAIMDRAWILLMLHSGLRSGEVRRLKFADMDWENRRVRIEQSKGLKDRIVCVSTITLEAIKEYLIVRGPADALPDQVFIYRHAALSESYCGQRLLKYYGQRIGLHITPHQLRHSCATLLLNAGAPILTVQTILGHQHIDTTLGYARLYDGTVAADYYRAMAQIEPKMAVFEDKSAEPLTGGQLIALVDSLRSGTLNESQLETVRVLRAGLAALSERVDTERQLA